MNILIIEDEALAARRLKMMVAEMDPTFRIAAMLDSVRKSVQWLKENPSPDAILMDIELSDGKSFDIFEKTTVQCPVIFITAYDEYAIRAFKVNSIDYLLKPVKQEELKRSIEKLRQLRQTYSQSKQDTHIQTLLQELQKRTSFRERLLIKQGDKLIPIEINDIAFFFAKDKSNFVRTKEQRDFIIDQTLDEVEASVDPGKFFRANRQYIISNSSIDKVHLWFGSKLKVDLKPKSDDEVIVSREKATMMRRWLGE